MVNQCRRDSAFADTVVQLIPCARVSGTNEMLPASAFEPGVLIHRSSRRPSITPSRGLVVVTQPARCVSSSRRTWQRRLWRRSRTTLGCTGRRGLQCHRARGERCDRKHPRDSEDFHRSSSSKQREPRLARSIDVDLCAHHTTNVIRTRDARPGSRSNQRATVQSAIRVETRGGLRAEHARR